MKKKLRSAFLLESLEARLLFSADLAPMPVDGGNPGAEVESGLEISLQPDNGGMQAAETIRQEQREAIFVDEAVDDYQQLIDNIESQLEKGRQFDIVALDSDRDGIAQISAYLSQQQDVAAVHIISHGADGELVLGNGRLNATTLDGYAEAIEGWQQALSGDADLLFYGCNMAAGDKGQELVNSLTLLTGADVAASDDVTGSAQFGGDWVLEYGKGVIETAVAVSSETQQNWNGVLAAFTVNTTADTVDVNPGDGIAEDADGNTSLRAAIMEANAFAEVDSITLSAGTYSLSIAGTGDEIALTGDLDITSEMTISGLGAGATIIDGGGLDSVFHVDFTGNATITNLTIQNGGNVTHGGGIRVTGGGSGGRLNLDNVIVSNNMASVTGGGIFVDGVVTLTDVEISGNTTSGTGGGLSNDEQATLTGVTISGNSATDGAGIFNSNQGNLLSLNNVTISGNTATANGGGIHTARVVTLTNVTVASNLGGGGIYATGGQGDVELKNSILADNSGGNSNKPLTSLGHNIEDGNTAFTPIIGDQPNTDPSLGPLQNNGGFTQTHALLSGSPAIDAGDNSVGLTEDQRGYARPIDGNGDATATIDIGAFEYTIDSLGTVNEFRVNDVTETGRQETSGDADHSQRSVVVADDGSYVVVWSSDGQDAFGWGVYAQRFDKFGNELTGEILVNEIETGSEQWARAVCDGSGNFVVTWTSDHSGTMDVYARRFNSTGAALGGEFRVNTTTSNDQQDSSIAMDAFGNFVVVWEGQGSVDSAGVFYRRFQANGTAIDTTEMRANLTDDGTEQDVSVAMNAAGDFVIVWEEGGRIKFQMFASDGTPGTASTVYIDTVSSNPDVAMDALGNFVVVYRWNGGSGQGVWGHKFNTTGNEQGLWFRVGPGNHTVNKDHDTPSLTMDDLGNFIVTYESTAEGGPGETVFAERFQSDKTSLGEFQVNQTTVGDQHMASVAMLDLDNYVVAFTGEDGDQAGVFARSYGTAVNTAPTATNLTSTSSYNEGDASVAISDIVVSDTDTGETIKAMLTLNDTSTGSLTANDGASYDSGTGIWTITDTVPNVNTALANLVFNPNVNNDVDTTIGVVIDDGDEDGSGPLTGTITLDVTPVDITSDLIVHLEFSEGSGTTAFDSTAYGNDAYLTGSQDWVSGTIGGGFHFDYSDGEDFFEINNAASVQNLQEGSFTLAAWFKADDVPPVTDAYGIIVKEGWHTGVWYNSAKQIVFEHTLSGPSYPRVVSTNTYDPGSSHHIAVTLDRPSGTITLYVDGVFENSSNFAPGAPSWEYFSETWKVGTARNVFPTSVDFPAKGSVDDVRIYSRAISAADAAALFDLGNRAPTATNLTSTSVYNEGDASVPITDIVVSDVDTSETITATLTLADITTGNLSANNGATYDGGTGIWTITDTLANVNTALANLVFSPLTNNDVDTTIGVSIDDGDEDVSGPLTGTITLDVTPANDAPTATNLTSTSVYNEGDASVPITDIVVSDVDTAENVTATLTLADTTTGNLSANNGATYDGGTGIWTITDTLANVNTALANLVFSPLTNNDVDTTIGVSIDDGDEDVSGPLTGTITLDVTPANDAPTATNLTSTSVYNEGDASVPITDIVVSDVDTAENVTATLTLADTTTGNLSANNGATYDGGTGIWTITDTLANVNTALANLVFSPLTNNDVDTTIGVSIDDGDEDVSGPLTGTITLDVTPANDAPTATNLTSTSVYNEGDASVPITDIVVSDVDTAENVTATLTLADTTTGNLSANNGATYDGGTGIWTITDTLANVNTALANLVFSPLTNNDVDTTIGVSIDDGDEDVSGPLTGTITLDVTPANDAPTATNLTSTSVYNEGDASVPITDIVVSDVDTAENVTATLTLADTTTGNLSANNGATYDGGTGIWTITDTLANVNTALANPVFSPLTNNDVDTTIGVSIDDGDEDVSGPLTGTITLDVTPANDAPTITSAANTAATEDSAYSYTFTVNDVDVGDTITLSAPTLPGWLSFDPATGILAGTPTNAEVGDHTVVLRVNDGTVDVDQSFTITVANTNDAPTITSVANTAATEDSLYSYTFTVNDVDVGDTITLSAPTLPGWLSFDPVTGILAGTPTNAEVGDHTVVLRVNDGTVDVDQNFTITVANTNDAPTITSAANTAATEDSAYSYTFTVNDVDVGDTLTLSAPTLPGWLSFDPATGILAGTPTNAEVGDHTVVLRVNDGTVNVDQSFTITVANTNDAGTVTIDNTTPTQGDILTAGVTDADGASGAISYQWFSGGVAIGGATSKTYATTQADVGTIITVTAVYADDLGTAESLTSAGTAPVMNVNETPVAVNDNLNTTEDQSITFTSVTALLGNDSDADGDTLTISGFTQPANGMLADNADGTFTYTPVANFNGNDSFTYTISDGNGETATGKALIVIAPVGDTPQVTSVSAISEVLSELIFINRNPSDGPEVTHFKISGITNGALYLADGVTRIENGNYITVEQGQAGLKFIPAAGSTADGSFNVESSEDGVSVAPQSGIATSNITILTTAPSALEQSLPSSDPEPVVSEEAVPEESEVAEDVADEPDVQTNAGNLDPVEPLQSSKVPRTAKASLGHGVSFLKRADFDSNDDQTPDRSILLSPQTLKMLLEAEDLGELKTALKKLGITTLSPEDYELVRSSLDAIKEEIDRETLIGRTVLGSAIATSIGLSAGYVVWMLKGGSLLASVLSSLPAWQLADPLAILVGKKEDEDDDEDEDDSLKTIIAEGSGRDEGKKSRDSDLDNIRKESKKR